MISDLTLNGYADFKYVCFPTLNNMTLLMTEEEIKIFEKNSKDYYVVFDYYPSAKELKKIKLKFLQKN